MDLILKVATGKWVEILWCRVVYVLYIVSVATREIWLHTMFRIKKNHSHNDFFTVDVYGKEEESTDIAAIELWLIKIW